MKRGAILLIALMAVILLFAIACGGMPTLETTIKPIPTDTPTPPPPCEEPTLEISTNGDALAFDKDKCVAAAESEVVLVFDNVSSFSQHNWVLVKPGTKDDVAKRGSEAGPDNGYVQPDDPDVIAHTKLADPGEAVEVRFAAPPADTYQFVCTFPGHNLIMFGDFVVTP